LWYCDDDWLTCLVYLWWSDTKRIADICVVVVIILFGLMRSLFRNEHHTTAQDSSLGPSFIIGNITTSNEIPIPYGRALFAKCFSFSKHSMKCLWMTKYLHQFHSLLRSEDETFLSSYISLENWHSQSCRYSIIRSTLCCTRWPRHVQLVTFAVGFVKKMLPI
jgi:hypothetical protein